MAVDLLKREKEIKRNRSYIKKRSLRVHLIQKKKINIVLWMATSFLVASPRSCALAPHNLPIADVHHRKIPASRTLRRPLQPTPPVQQQSSHLHVHALSLSTRSGNGVPSRDAAFRQAHSFFSACLSKVSIFLPLPSTCIIYRTQSIHPKVLVRWIHPKPGFRL